MHRTIFDTPVVNTVLRAQRDQVVLIEQCRPGPDKAHVTFENAQELGQFV